MSVKLRWFLFALSLFPVALSAQSTVTVTDASIAPGATVNWTNNNTYVLDGLVYVDSASVLNIQAGTVIKGKATPTTDNTSALIVARHGKIYATGTAANPIIFTAEIDDVTDPDDLTVEDRGLWGGVIILGNAQINTTSGVGQIEGIASEEPRGAYGGEDDEDNSGIFRYVSIRHGGSEIGAGNEINGLTMGAVGSGTTIEYVEVLSNLDDGYEWFGGTVSTKYLVAAFCADDAFDFDEGWTGKNQFWFALQGTDFAGRIAEQDGGTTPEDGTPFAIPLIYNATYIGPGAAATPQGDGAQALIFRDNAGGKYYNSIITDYNGQGGGAAVTVEDLVSGADSRERLEMGDLVLNNNIWWGFGAGAADTNLVPQSFVRTHFNANNNQIIDPELRSISRTGDNGLDPRPDPAGPAASGAVAPGDAFFTNVSYYGAFSPSGPVWIGGWTAISSYSIVTGIEEISNTAPTSYMLEQNYPNPFNPSTVITYSLLKSGNVSLKVYDILGREVATLVDGHQNAGSYRVQFDASGLSTGMYLYRISAGDFHEVRKMTLTK
ncbi:MAG: T9SS type A sorting domain-containing protein [Ignavibacteriae bacterium]|nr:T9SS type A sorting domain-containing protein [Ignavibacteriota bacterium]